MNLGHQLARLALGVVQFADIVRGRRTLPDWDNWDLINNRLPSEIQVAFPKALQLIPDVYACVTLIAEQMACMPLRFYEGDAQQKEEIGPGTDSMGRKTPTDLFRTANPIHTGFDLVEQIVASLKVSGNSYLYQEDFGTGYPEELWCLPGHEIETVRGKNRTIQGYLWSEKLKPQKALTPDRVTPIREYDPDHGIEGLSPLFPLRQRYETQYYASDFLKEFYRQGAAVSIVLERTMPVANTKQEQDRVREQLMEKYAGARNAFRPLLLPAYFKLVRLGLTFDEMKFLESSGLTSADIFRVFKVPPVLLGVKDGGGLSDAGAKTDRLLFVQNVMQPLARRIESAINEKFLNRKDYFGNRQLFCEFDFSRVLTIQEVWLDQAKSYTTATGAPIMTVDEARARLPGLDVISDPKSGELLRPVGMVTASDEAAMAEAAPTVPPDSGAPPGRAIIAPWQLVRGAEPESRTAASLQSLRVRHERRSLPRERMFKVAVRRMFTRQEREIVAALKTGDGTLVESRVLDLNQLLSDTGVDRSMVRRLLEAIAMGAGNEALADLALDLAMDMTKREVATWLETRSSWLVSQINSTTRFALQASLAEGQLAGDTPGEMIARVREVFQDRRGNAADIARTETNAGANFGTIEAWEQTDGIVEGKQWLTARDEAVRQAHRDAEQLGTIPLDQPFTLTTHDGTVIEMDYPCAPGAPAELVVNCRCAMVPVLSARARHMREPHYNGNGTLESMLP